MPRSVEGTERLLAKLAAIPPSIRKAVSEAMQIGADEITNSQKALAPVATGALRNSIRNVKGDYAPDNPNVRGFGAARRGDPELSIHLVAGDAKAWYAALVEHGTPPHEQGGKFKGTQHPGTRPRPFFYPPYRLLRKRYKRRVSSATTKACKAEAAK